MAIVTMDGGDLLPTVKIKTIANFEDIITQGTLTPADYNLDLGGLTILMFRKACQANFVQMAVDQYYAGIQAQGELTVDTQVDADDTITLGATTYTFKAGATAVAGQIGIGSNVGDCQLAITAAINGTDSFNTANASVSAGTFTTNAALITALVAGTAGNSIVSTSSFTTGTNQFDATTLGTERAGVASYTLPTLNLMEGGEFLNEIRIDLNANFVILDTEINP